MWISQWPGTFPGHAQDSDAVTETERSSLQPTGCQYFPPVRLQNEKFTFRCRLWDWRKRACVQWDAHCEQWPAAHTSLKTFSPAFFSLVQLCLQQDPEKRPSASSLLSHVFFKQMKEESQDSILSLLPPASAKPSAALPPVLPWTEPECAFPDEKDSDWEF